MIGQFSALAAGVLLWSSASAADWSALSTTAIGITGDVRLNERQIIFDDVHAFRVERTRELTAAELEALHDLTGQGGITRANLYKVHIPVSAKLRNGNSLCGRGAATQMIAAFDGEKQLVLVFFSGPKEPLSPGWKDRTDICGSFSFARY